MVQSNISDINRKFQKLFTVGLHHTTHSSHTAHTSAAHTSHTSHGVGVILSKVSDDALCCREKRSYSRGIDECCSDNLVGSEILEIVVN